MHPSLRRIRGIIGTAVTWAVGWGALGFVAGVPQWTVVGFTAGAGFAVALVWAERRGQVETLALRRTALWGAVGAAAGAGLAVPWLWATSGGALQLLPFLGFTALLGAGSATGTLLAIRGASARSRLAAREGPRGQHVTANAGDPTVRIRALGGTETAADREAAT